MIPLWSTADLTGLLDEALGSPKYKGASIGVYVGTPSGEVLYSRNADLLLMPASNQKLLSIAYALWKLGPEFVPVTRFWKTPAGLVVDAPGDPSLTYDRLVQARKSLGAAPKGKVFVRQAFRPGYAPGWEWDDLPNRYAPTISAFSFDKGGFELWGSPSKLWIKPDTFGIKVVHAPWKQGPNAFDLGSKRLLVTSTKPKLAAKIEAFALPNPDYLAAQILGGTLAVAKDLPKSKPTLSIRGDSLAKMALDCLQPSDNFMAESLMLIAAGKDNPLPQDAFGEASMRMKAFLVGTVGLSPEDVDPYDGSGLSRHNNVTAIGIAKLLRWASEQPWSDAWAKALASPGVGTLKNRLHNCEFKGKTGTLNKASSLSGYVKCKDGRELVVSILMNHYLCGDSAARDGQDEIIRIIEASTPHGQKVAHNRPSAFSLSHAYDRIVHADRLRRSDFDGNAPRARADRRDEPAYAPLLEPRRMALRPR